MATKKETANETVEEVKEVENLRPAVAEEGAFLANAVPMEKKKIFIYKSENPDSKDSKDVFVCINGKTYQIKRGAEAEVPFNVALVLEQSMEMSKYANKYGRLVAPKQE